MVFPNNEREYDDMIWSPEYTSINFPHTTWLTDDMFMMISTNPSLSEDDERLREEACLESIHSAADGAEAHQSLEIGQSPTLTSEVPLLGKSVDDLGTAPHKTSLLPLRQLRPRETDTASGQHVLPSALPTSLTARKPRGRKRSLSPDGKKHAAEVRLVGACVRCRKMKEKCDKEQPCTPCRSNARRTLPFPCTRELPADRGVHLLTDLTTGHLNEKKFQEVIKDLKRYPDKHPFDIELRQDFPYPLKLKVIEYEPINPQDILRTIFPIVNVDGVFKVKPDKLISPPLLPIIPSARHLYNLYVKDIQFQIGRWLKEIEVDPDCGFHNIFFHPSYGRAWPRDILAMVCKFFHTVMYRGCEALTFALKTAVLIHMIGHVFYIVPQTVPMVWRNMHFGQGTSPPTEFLCPQHIDRYIKILMYPVLVKCVHRTMGLYQAMYPGKKVTLLTRDRFLAVSLVLLIIAGAQQQIAVERGHIKLATNEEKDLSASYRHVEEIETEFVQTIFDLWDYKMNIRLPIITDSERDQRLPAIRAKDYGLLEKFRDSYDSHTADLEDLDPQLSFEVKVQDFSATNTTRLLKRFHRHVFGSNNHKDEVQ